LPRQSLRFFLAITSIKQFIITPLITRTVEVLNRAGLHTRPAAAIVKLAAEFKSEFYIDKDGFQINGKSIIGVMTLAAAQRSKLELSFDGPDEEAMANAIVDYFAKGFEEM
jgi:phosphocarrier protein HPr